MAPWPRSVCFSILFNSAARVPGGRHKGADKSCASSCALGPMNHKGPFSPLSWPSSYQGEKTDATRGSLSNLPVLSVCLMAYKRTCLHKSAPFLLRKKLAKSFKRDLTLKGKTTSVFLIAPKTLPFSLTCAFGILM